MLQLLRSAAQWHIHRRDGAIAAELKQVALGRDVMSIVREYATINYYILEENLVRRHSARTGDIHVDPFEFTWSYSFSTAGCYMCDGDHYPHVHIDMIIDDNHVTYLCAYSDILMLLETGDDSFIKVSIREWVDEIYMIYVPDDILNTVITHLNELIW